MRVHYIQFMQFVQKEKESEESKEQKGKEEKEKVEGHSNYLAAKHAHERDAFIRFYEVGHRYDISICPKDKTKYTSVTTWNHGHFPKFDADKVIQNMMRGRKWNTSNKYWGQTPDEIKAQWAQNGATVSAAGTEMHFQIECFMNARLHDVEVEDSGLANDVVTHADLLTHYAALPDDQKPNISEEWSFFLQFVSDFPKMKPYRTEWTVFDETVKVAGSIDMVYQNPEDETLSIYDWKRCKDITPENPWAKFATNPILDHIPDTNFWHYTLQLNTYKQILERKYGVRVRDLVLVRLHPDNPEQTYELIDVPILSREMNELFDLKREEVLKANEK